MAAQDNGNWFKLYRGILDNTAWTQGSNIQRVLMITLLAKAWWKPGKYIWAGRVVHMQPGQLITTLGELTELCSASKSSIRTALDHLETVEFLTRQSTRRGMLISIVNWGKYQQDTSGISTPDSTPSTHQPHTNSENLAVDQHTSRTPPSSYNMYKNIKESKELEEIEEIEEREEGKKGASLPFPVLKILETFESDHQSHELTEALISWARMRIDKGHLLYEKNLRDQLYHLMDISGGDIPMAVKIAKQSVGRGWSQFWPLKEAPQMVRYPKVEKRELKGPPPPKPEDYPGDPAAFQRAMNEWTALQGDDNRRVIHRLGPEPTEEEREKILKAMGHIESP